jgi:hypothetical protein
MQLAHLQLKSCDAIICLCIFSGQREDKGEQANTKKWFYKQKKKNPPQVLDFNSRQL